jgi:Las17-binding protein actin regulator
MVGGAHGRGRVYVHGIYVGDTSMNQLSAGFQSGGQAYSQIVFLEDRRAFDEFTKANFEFGADFDAVAITAAVWAQTEVEPHGRKAARGQSRPRPAAALWLRSRIRELPSFSAHAPKC